MTAVSTGAWARFRQLPKTTRLVLGVHLLNTVGSGLVLPFLAIYVAHANRGAAATGSFALVALAAGSVIANAIAGQTSDHFGPRTVLGAGWIINAVGNVCLVVSHGRGPLLASSALIGVGAGLAYPALRTLLAVVTPDEDQPMAFSAEHAVLNIGFSVGALIAALVIGAASLTELRVVYLVDALSFLIVAAILPLIAGTSRPPATATDEAARGEGGGYRAVFADRAFRRVCTIQGLLVIFGYAQFGAAVPLWLTHSGGVSTRAVALVVAANTLTVSIAALPIANATRHLHRRTLVTAGAITFALSWVLLPLSALTHTPIGIAVAALSAAVMGVAECLLAPAIGPIVNALAPEQLRGHYNAVDAFTLSIGTIIGPTITAALIAGPTGQLFAVLTVGCLIAAAIAMRSTTLRTV
jgi:MFS family permease